MNNLIKPRTARARVGAVATVVLATIVFFALVGAASHVVQAIAGEYGARGLHQQITMRLTGSAVGEFLSLLVLIVWLNRTGQSLSALGFGRRAPLRGWIAAAIVTAAVLFFFLSGPLRGRAALAEPTFFHIYNSLLAGIAAGFCEEIFFRGFVMTRLDQARVATWLQVVASGLLFGVAHAGWGSLSGHADARVLVASIVSTAILGWIYALVYVISRRTLMPVIAAHVITDAVIEPWLALVALGGFAGR
ncbi:MAG TPA: CPBP family intramembrane glutamic endopeptidase [Casimicrobiaceae bacterium]|nr:CPBP family intramembrane glutamic endopeptidase [Casimicrobiaceae bacterium]